MSLDGPFSITLDSNDATFNILGDEKLRLTSLGNVGIGTTDVPPNSHMTIYEPQSSSGAASIQLLQYWDGSDSYRGTTLFSKMNVNGVDNDFHIGLSSHNGNRDDPVNNSKFTIKGANGNVGIGTTAPSRQLTISKSSNTVEQLELRTTGGISDGQYTGIKFTQDSDGGTTLGYIRCNFQSDGSSAISFATRSGEKMRISDDGKVGIGTTDPQTTLDVNGEIRGAYDTNSASYFGRAVIGYNHMNASRGGTYDDWASFSHLDMKHSSGYALLQSAQGETIINAAYGYPIHFCINDSTKISMGSNGYLGIGTTSPGYPLHITNYVGADLNARYFRQIHGLTFPDSNTSFQVSLFAAGGIFCNGIIGATSDRRIKKDIVEINDDTALQQIRLLKPSKYRYRDYINRGTEEVIGFIAQEVREAIPQAVKIHTDDIPNVMLMGSGLTDASDNHIITIPDYDTSSLEVDASGNIFPKLKIVIDEDDKDKELFVNIQEVISTTKLKVELIDDDITELPSEIFIYGQEVDNKHILVKDRIFAVGMSALQEVDRQLQAEKTKTASLETKVASLETQVADILQRLSNAGIINKNNY